MKLYQNQFHRYLLIILQHGYGFMDACTGCPQGIVIWVCNMWLETLKLRGTVIGGETKIAAANVDFAGLTTSAILE